MPPNGAPTHVPWLPFIPANAGNADVATQKRLMVWVPQVPGAPPMVGYVLYRGPIAALEPDVAAGYQPQPPPMLPPMPPPPPRPEPELGTNTILIRTATNNADTPSAQPDGPPWLPPIRPITLPTVPYPQQVAHLVAQVNERCKEIDQYFALLIDAFEVKLKNVGRAFKLQKARLDLLELRAERLEDETGIGQSWRTAGSDEEIEDEAGEAGTHARDRGDQDQVPKEAADTGDKGKAEQSLKRKRAFGNIDAIS